MGIALPYVAAAATAASAGAAIYSATKGSPSVPQQPKPPGQDTAANAAQQQADLLRRRKGVLANIYGGATGQVAPVTASKTALGD